MPVTSGSVATLRLVRNSLTLECRNVFDSYFLTRILQILRDCPNRVLSCLVRRDAVSFHNIREISAGYIQVYCTITCMQNRAKEKDKNRPNITIHFKFCRTCPSCRAQNSNEWAMYLSPVSKRWDRNILHYAIEMHYSTTIAFFTCMIGLLHINIDHLYQMQTQINNLP